MATHDHAPTSDQPANQRDARRVSIGNRVRPEIIREQRAVVVGINQYRDSFHSLENAVKDASALAQLLKSDYGFILAPGNEPLLDEEATAASIKNAVTESLRTSHSAIRWFFFFAGHGFADSQQGYLIPSQAEYGNIDAYISLHWLIETCSKSECGETLLVLDACYAGQAMLKPEDLDDRIPPDEEKVRVRQVITSGNPDDPVLDGGKSGHSVFTQVLLTALSGWAGIHQPGGAIRFPALLEYLVLEVPRQVLAQGFGAQAQQPVGGNLAGNRDQRHFILQPIAPRLNPETIRGMNSPDPVRRVANLARLVVDVQAQPETSSQAIQLAVAHLHPPDPSRPGLPGEPAVEARTQAAKTLGELKDPSALEDLAESLGDQPEITVTAANALAAINDPRAAPPLINALKCREDSLFLSLISAIAGLDEPAGWIAALTESLRRKRLVPLIGPDLPTRLTGVSDRSAVIQSLSPTANSLAQAAAGRMWGDSRQPFLEIIRRLYMGKPLPPGSIYRDLARLPVHFWISGAYDTLLDQALSATSIIDGDESTYAAPGQPLVCHLAGAARNITSLLVLESDYITLRAEEGKRQALLNCLRTYLKEQVVLLLGYDPASPDFAILVEQVLNRHLAGIPAQAFLVWPQPGPAHTWQDRPIRQITTEPLEMLAVLQGGTFLDR